jgi:diguanylate cyclase (GGDEF)-like protein
MKTTIRILKKPIALTTLVFILATPLLVWTATTLVWSRALMTLAGDSEHHLVLYVRGLESSIQLTEQIAVAISHSVAAINLLKDPHHQPLQDAANRYLEQMNTEIHAKTLYVMDQQGTTIAASNWREGNSFVGQNYAFRPYFQGALQGQNTHYIALGVTSGELGLYVANPIWVDGEIRGVAVIKTSLDRHRLLSIELEQLFVVTDQNGIVFLSSRDEWLYTALHTLPPYRRKALLEFRQYSGKPLSPFPEKTLMAINGTSRLVRLEGFPANPFIPGFGEATHLSQSTFFISHGWEIRTFSSLKPVYLAAWVALASSLLVSLVAFLSALFLIQRRLYIRKLRDASIRDPLTRLHTRRYLFDAVNTQLSQLNRRKTDCLVGAMLDIDHFKRVNDAYGHKAGDTVLRAVAQAIKHSIRKGDVAARYGGEEFTIILGIEKGENAVSCIERVRANTQALHFDPPLDAVQITLSVGIAHYQTGENLDDLLARADELLYRAKNLGRDRVCCDRPELLPIEPDHAKQLAG